MPFIGRVVERPGGAWLVGVLCAATCVAACTSARTATPPPTVTAPVDRSLSRVDGPIAQLEIAGRLRSRALLEASDAAMVRQAGSAVVNTVSRAGTSSATTEAIEELRPSTTTARADGGYAIGRRDIPEAISRSNDVRIIGVGEVDGVDAWVIWYTFRFLTLEGVINVWRTEWIDMGSLRLLRQFEQDDDGFNPYESIDRRFAYDR